MSSAVAIIIPHPLIPCSATHDDDDDAVDDDNDDAADDDDNVAAGDGNRSQGSN